MRKSQKSRFLHQLTIAAALVGCVAGTATGTSYSSCPVAAASCTEDKDAFTDEDSSLIQLVKPKDGLHVDEPEPRRRSNLTAGRVSYTYPEYQLNSGYKNPLCKKKRPFESKLLSEITNRRVHKWLTDLVNLPKSAKPSRSAVETDTSKAAVRYLKDKFESMGLATCGQNFAVSSGSYQGKNTNVIAYIPGSDPAAGSVTFGAHYDSRPYDTKAPGADDNGSGTAAVLATAMAYAKTQAPPEKSIYFVAFGAEEIGLWGSHAFVRALQNHAVDLPKKCRPENGFPSGADHRAITLDMVGWLSTNAEFPTPTLTLETKPWSTDVTEEVAQVSKEYNGDRLNLQVNTAPFGSDHMSFLNKNLHAMLAIHGDDTRYPAYHSSQDVLENTNQKLMGMITRSCAGALMRIANIDMRC